MRKFQFQKLHPIVSLAFAVAALLAATRGAGADMAQAAPPLDVQVHVSADRDVGALPPIWRFFGADEPNYATMKDGRALLAELGQLRPNQVYFRAHNLLTSGDGVPALKWGSTNAYTETADGRPVYDWTILDRIFDTYRERGVRPYAQIGFMPEALSVHPEPYQHEWRPGASYGAIGTGWSYPPKDYRKWEDLVSAWVRHCVERYGRAEVEQWYWEVWNEPNGRSYWHASPDEYCKLYDFAVAGVRRALPTARVGGPELAGSTGKFMETFLQHCVSGVNYASGERGAPVDFLSFHAKGAPSYVDHHVRLGIAAHLSTIEKGFRLIGSVPELSAKPIVIGESDPDGCAACQGPQLGYRVGTMYSSYTAATIAREYALADQCGVNLEGALTWAFEFEDQPFFAGQRVLATNRIDLPVLNVFRMLSRMGGRRVVTISSAEIPLPQIVKDGVRGAPDIAALSALEPGKLAVLVWYYHDDDLPGPPAHIRLAIDRLPWPSGAVRLTHYRIDEAHSNPYEVWKRMGSPTAPNEAEYARLRAAGALAILTDAPTTAVVDHGATHLDFTLPRQGVSLLLLEPGAAATR